MRLLAAPLEALLLRVDEPADEAGSSTFMTSFFPHGAGLVVRDGRRLFA